MVPARLLLAATRTTTVISTTPYALRETMEAVRLTRRRRAATRPVAVPLRRIATTPVLGPIAVVPTTMETVPQQAGPVARVTPLTGRRVRVPASTIQRHVPVPIVHTVRVIPTVHHGLTTVVRLITRAGVPIQPTRLHGSQRMRTILGTCLPLRTTAIPAGGAAQ